MKRTGTILLWIVSALLTVAMVGPGVQKRTERRGRNPLRDAAGDSGLLPPSLAATTAGNGGIAQGSCPARCCQPSNCNVRSGVNLGYILVGRPFMGRRLLHA